MHGVDVSGDQHASPDAAARDRTQRNWWRRIGALARLHDPRRLGIAWNLADLRAQRREPRAHDRAQTHETFLMAGAGWNRHELREVALHRGRTRGELRSNLALERGQRIRHASLHPSFQASPHPSFQASNHASIHAKPACPQARRDRLRLRRLQLRRQSCARSPHRSATRA